MKMKESHKMDEARFHAEVMAEQEQAAWEAAQDERMRDAFAEYIAGHESAYDLDDPKHPDYAERMAEMVDIRRKEQRENGESK